MRSNSRKIRDDFNANIESTFRKYRQRKAAKTRLKKMNGGYKCDKEYNEVVVPYWERFGYKPAKYWFELYCDREQKIDPRYIPADLFYGELVPYFSNSDFRRFGEDKCYHDVWFPEMMRPGTVCKNIAGVFYDKDMNIITKEQAIELCMNHNGAFLVKPSVDTGEGRLIEFFEEGEATPEAVESVFDGIDCNFIVQDGIKQHKDIAQFNPSSVNTIRMITFLFKGKVYLLSSILRVGAPKSKVDNIGAGGYACPITEDGHLLDKAVNRNSEWVEQTTEGVKFKDVVIPEYQKAIDIAMKAHTKLAHFKLIGWDFAIDENGNPIMIEYNTCPGMNQFTCGPMFGDLTEDVLREYFIEKQYKNACN